MMKVPITADPRIVRMAQRGEMPSPAIIRAGEGSAGEAVECQRGGPTADKSEEQGLLGWNIDGEVLAAV
jgi:hypothetical protein